MVKVLCDKCGKDCGLNALAITTEVINNPCPVHLQDCGELQITCDHSRIRYILCQECYIGLGLPNVYSTIRNKKLEFRDTTKTQQEEAAMKHYLYECTDPDSECKGEEFLVGANDRKEARQIAINNFKCARFICEMTEYEAEASGLDEYRG